LAHCEKQEDQATDNQDGKRVVRTPSRRELASRPQQAANEKAQRDHQLQGHAAPGQGTKST